jgi:hypothetical protein
VGVQVLLEDTGHGQKAFLPEMGSHQLSASRSAADPPNSAA